MLSEPEPQFDGHDVHDDVDTLWVYPDETGLPIESDGWQGWRPWSEDEADQVDLKDEIIDLELADDPGSESDATRRMGLSGTVVSLLLHVWLLINLSGFFPSDDVDSFSDQVIDMVFREPVEVEEPEEIIEYELANPDERELEVREVINAASVGIVRSEAPRPEDAPTPLTEVPPIELRAKTYDIPEGMEVDDRIVVKGSIGEAVIQFESALDMVTWEIANNLQERKVLLIWMLDASASLNSQRQAIRKRLKRIYGELDALKETGQLTKQDKPLLTGVVSYGQRTTFLTKAPTGRFSEIEKAFAAVKTDNSGKEYAFTAVRQVMSNWGAYRIRRGRRIMLVAITDEAGDDHGPPLEAAITICRRRGAKAYVIGPSAPFGTRKGYVPYVAPENGKTYQLPVDLGPEAAIADHVSLPFWFNGPQYNRPPLSSGFAPYSLARLVRETGGIYFMTSMTTMAGLAPIGRFDAASMRPFEPDYSYASPEDCRKDLLKHPLRMAVYNAAMISRKYKANSTPQLSIRVTPQNFKQVASEAQKTVARSELIIREILTAFPRGIEAHYHTENAPRWRMAYDLAHGRLLAQQVRCMEYNYACAQLKNDLTPQDVGSKSNHWIFRPDSKLNYATSARKMARQATEQLERVVQEAPGTPFGVLAARELKDPLGMRIIHKYVPPVQRRPARPTAAAPNRPRVLFARKKNKNTPPPRPAPPPKPPRLPKL